MAHAIAKSMHVTHTSAPAPASSSHKPRFPNFATAYTNKINQTRVSRPPTAHILGASNKDEQAMEIITELVTKPIRLRGSW
jgi:hypothetical protein